MSRTKNISLFIATLLVAMLLPLGVSAQDDRLAESWQNSDRHGVSVDFRVNSTVIDENYRNNALFFDQVDSLVNVVNNDPILEIVSVEICGTASPEGPAAVNHRLSNARMMALDKYLRSHLELPDSIVVHNDKYIAWDHLAELIESDPSPIARKSEVLEILQQSDLKGRDMKGRDQDGRINAIQRIDNGVTWSILNQRYFAQMRNAWFIMVTVRNVEPEPEPLPEIVEPEPVAEPEVVEPEPEPIPEPEPMAEPQDVRVPLMNFKINAVEAAALIANFGMEFRITPYLSFDVMGHYSPYDYFNDVRKIRVFAIQPELRYWFGESLVKGHFVGVHVPVAGFNIQLNDKYRYQDPNRALWGVGVSYGYAMPLGKKGNWGVEFTIGVGYMNLVYDVYEGVHNGKLLRTESKHYFGPTRLGIDFSYRIDMKKNNKKTKTIGE